MASTYCSVKLTTDTICPKLKLTFAMKRKNIPLHIIEAEGTYSQRWDSNQKFQTKRILSNLQPLTLGCAVPVHISWGLQRICDASKEFFQAHPSKDT